MNQFLFFICTPVIYNSFLRVEKKETLLLIRVIKMCFAYRILSNRSMCILPHLPPANVQQKVLVKTNVYVLEITDRIVYRYDVRMEACSGRPHTANATKVNLCCGKQE